MTLNQLRYVIKVAETGSINKAASNLFISQSVLSTSIKSLEKELEHELFIRSPKGIELTPYGKLFLSYITPIEEQLRQLDHFLYKEGGDSNLNLSLVSNGFPFVSHIWATLYQKYASAGIRINHQEAYGNDAMNLVSSGLADIGVVRLWNCYENVYRKQFESMKIEFQQVASLDIAISVGPQNPLYNRKENWVTPDMLSNYPMVMYEYMDSGPFSDIIGRLHLKSSSSRFSTSARAALYEALSYTDAYYLNSDYHVCQYFQMEPNLHYVDQRVFLLKDCEIKSLVGWIKRTDKPLSPIACEALEMVYSYLSPRST
ncbi:MAG: LysR family transcriptional regulator [Bariatricus sp.]